MFHIDIKETSWSLQDIILTAKQKERQDYNMAMEDKSLGLCFTCDNKEICTRREGIRFPVLFCEEFENLTSYQMKVPVKLVLNSDKPDMDISMGLCCNCSNRDSCTSRNSPGGIWHCEEYC